MDLALATPVEGQAAAGRQARRGPVRHAGAGVPAGEGSAARRRTRRPASRSRCMGRGRSVVGGSLHTQITPADVRQAILDGFFPPCPRDAEPARAARTGLAGDGPAVRLRPGGDAAPRGVPAAAARSRTSGPDAILFNGGVFQPQALRDRLVEVMRPWYGGRLAAAGADQPVARSGGAVGRGVLRVAATHRRQAHRRRHPAVVLHRRRDRHAASAGIARSCASSRGGCRRARRSQLPKPELELALGQPVLFPLYTSTVRGDDKPGDVLTLPPNQLLQLPPLHTVLRGGKRSGAKRVPVTLAARCTEIGTLELYCVAKDGTTAGGWSSTSATSSPTPPTRAKPKRRPGGDDGCLPRGAGAEGRRTRSAATFDGAGAAERTAQGTRSRPRARRATTGRPGCAGGCGTFLEEQARPPRRGRRST